MRQIVRHFVLALILFPGITQAQYIDESIINLRLNLDKEIRITAANDGISCNGSSIQINTNLEEGDEFEWSNPEILNDPTSSNPVAQVSEDTKLVLRVRKNGQIIESFIELRLENVEAKFEHNPKGGSAPLTVKFDNQSSGAISYEWLVGVEKIYEAFPENTFTTSGKYPISLVAIGQFGCRDTTKIKEIEIVEEAEFFIPTTFTPNYDGLNETFGIISKNVGEFRCEIFSSYGELIKVIQSTSDEWDGSFNGYPAPSGKYVYKIRYKDLAGNSKKILGSVELRR